jgi:hypothetical protein
VYNKKEAWYIMVLSIVTVLSCQRRERRGDSTKLSAGAWVRVREGIRKDDHSRRLVLHEPGVANWHTGGWGWKYWGRNYCTHSYSLVLVSSFLLLLCSLLFSFLSLLLLKNHGDVITVFVQRKPREFGGTCLVNPRLDWKTVSEKIAKLMIRTAM